MSLALPLQPRASAVSATRSTAAEIALQLMLVAGIGGVTLLGIAASASSMRLLFPVLAFAIAALLLYRGDLATYVSFVIWIFLLTPFFRRLVDFKVGWEQVNLIMLAPYAAASISLFVVPLLLYRGARSALGLACLAIVLASFYGLLVAMFNGRVQSGLLEFLRWAVPPCLATLIAVNPNSAGSLVRRLEALLLVAMPLLGGYAVYQYLALPAWDGFWMTNSGMNSIGEPLPFRVRVFSTLNSPGSFAYFLMFGLTLLMSGRGWLRWGGVGIGAGAFLLSLVRAAWLGFFVGGCWSFLFGGAKTRLSFALLVFGAAFALPILLTTPMLMPQMGELLEQRLQTFGQLSGDTSLNDRSAGYQFLASELEKYPLGEGLGVAGGYQSADGGNLRIIDGGPIEIFLSLGVVVGAVYSAAFLFAAAAAMMSRKSDLPPNDLAGLQGVVLSNVMLMSSGTNTIGEIGLFFWLSLGIIGSASPGRRLATAPPTSQHAVSTQGSSFEPAALRGHIPLPARSIVS